MIEPASNPLGPFASVEVLEIVAFELFTQDQVRAHAPDKTREEEWRQDRFVREEFRNNAKSVFSRLSDLGLKLSAGKQSALTTRVAEIYTIPARPAYDLVTDLKPD